MKLWQQEGFLPLLLGILLIVGVVLGVIGFLTWVTLQVLDGTLDIMSGSQVAVIASQLLS